jgi:hypothetical protein
MLRFHRIEFSKFGAEKAEGYSGLNTPASTKRVTFRSQFGDS